MQINAITTRRDFHIAPHMGTSWTVKREGSIVAEANFRTQRDAITYGITLAKHEAVSMIIHGRDGRFRDVRSYDNYKYNIPTIMEKETR